MKRIVPTLLSLAFAASFGGLAVAQDYGPGRDPRFAGPDSARSDLARVTRVERMSHQRDPYLRQECWNESTRSHESGYYRDETGHLYRGDSSNKSTRTLIGAIVGGVLGNQVGDGRGRTAATIAGAAVGATVGSNSGRNDRDDDGYDRRNDGYDRYSDNAGVERRCRTVVENDDRGRGRGRGRDLFRVSYTYAGQSYQAMTNVDPGRTLRVLVNVRPEEDIMANRR